MRTFFSQEAAVFATYLLTKMRTREALQRSRIGIVAYRDFDDGEPQVLDFVTSSSEARAFMPTVRAYGGGDIPEDVQGGLKRALSLSWGPDASVCEGELVTRLIVHIADAPAHGPCECASELRTPARAEGAALTSAPAHLLLCPTLLFPQTTTLRTATPKRLASRARGWRTSWRSARAAASTTALWP